MYDSVAIPPNPETLRKSEENQRTLFRNRVRENLEQKGATDALKQFNGAPANINPSFSINVQSKSQEQNVKNIMPEFEQAVKNVVQQFFGDKLYKLDNAVNKNPDFNGAPQNKTIV
jgi:hypothetical protein